MASAQGLRLMWQKTNNGRTWLTPSRVVPTVGVPRYWVTIRLYCEGRSWSAREVMYMTSHRSIWTFADALVGVYCRTWAGKQAASDTCCRRGSTDHWHLVTSSVQNTQLCEMATDTPSVLVKGVGRPVQDAHVGIMSVSYVVLLPLHTDGRLTSTCITDGS